MPKPDNVLFFHSGSIGDFLMYLHLAQILHKANPHVRVKVVMPRNAAFLQGLLGSYPYVTLVAVSKRMPWRLLGLFADTKHLAVVLHPTIGRMPLRIKVLGWLLTRRPGSVLVGFQDKGPLCSFYTHTLSYSLVPLYHETLHRVATTLGVDAGAAVPGLLWRADPRVYASFNVEPQKYIVVHPGSSSRACSFSVDTAVAVVDSVSRIAPGVPVLLSGGAADKELLAQVAKRCRAVVCLGLSVGEVATLVAGARLYIGVDTGISHLASFLGTPAIVAAHENTTPNWLPWYAPHTTVLFRLKNAAHASSDRSLICAEDCGRVHPFGPVSAEDIVACLPRLLIQ
jgi:ADP-heptose:LPS heptosyltransferase